MFYYTMISITPTLSRETGGASKEMEGCWKR
jgi:hypothetical protein